MNVNFRGPLLCAQAVVPSMQARGGGRIVMGLSAGAFMPGGIYGVSKYALQGLTINLANGPAGKDGPFGKGAKVRQALEAALAICADFADFAAVLEHETVHRVFVEDGGDQYDGEARRHLVTVTVEAIYTTH